MTGATLTLTRVKGPMKLSRLTPLVVPAALTSVLALAPAQAFILSQPMAWGNPARGGPACGASACEETPQPAGPAGAVSVDAENSFNLAIMPGGTVMAWGAGTDGDLGDGSTKNSKAVPVQVTGLTGVTQTGGGDSDAIALEGNGSVWTWGNNDHGQLGTGKAGGDSTAPVRVSLPGRACAVDAGAAHMYAVACDGTVWAWGGGGDGVLGDGSTGGHDTPVQVKGLAGVVAIASGNLFGYAQETDGSWWSWGYGKFGQLCDGKTKNVLAPAAVPLLAGATDVSAGGNLATDGHILALLPGGIVEACGANASGQLGDGTTADSSRPVPVASLTGITAIAAGGYHSLALDSSGDVWAWGGNDHGQVGNGSTANVLEPVQVLSGTSMISAGSMHSLALGDG